MNTQEFLGELGELIVTLKRLLPQKIPVNWESRGRVLPDSELVFKSRERVTSDGDLTVPDDAIYVLLLPVNASNVGVDGGTFDYDTTAVSTTSPPIPYAGIQIPVRDINGMKVTRISVTVPSGGAVHVVYFGY